MTFRQFKFALREWLCRHDWKVSRFQALSSTPGMDCVCKKCGKIERLDRAALRHPRPADPARAGQSSRAK